MISIIDNKKNYSLAIEIWLWLEVEALYVDKMKRTNQNTFNIDVFEVLSDNWHNFLIGIINSMNYHRKIKIGNEVDKL